MVRFKYNEIRMQFNKIITLLALEIFLDQYELKSQRLNLLTPKLSKIIYLENSRFNL